MFFQDLDIDEYKMCIDKDPEVPLQFICDTTIGVSTDCYISTG